MTMPKIKAETIKILITESLLQKKCTDEVAERVAQGLVSTSLRGVDSHGIRLIHHYLEVIDTGRINVSPQYKIEKNMPTTAILDADNTFGHAAGIEAARLAVSMAKKYGSGHVAVKNSTHFGAAAYYGLEIAEHDMIGMSFTHSDSLIIPQGGKQSYLGNNPICFTAPVKGEEPFCLDMATSITTFNEIKRLRETGEQAPEGVGADRNGLPETDPEKITMLMPVGTYKGYGLSLMVEILCSLLTGMNYGSHISKMFEDLDKKRHLGQFYTAINIKGFQESDIFKARIAALVNELRNEPPLDIKSPVMVAGDPEKKMEKKRKHEGIPVTDAELNQFNALNQRCGLGLDLKA